MCEHELTLIIQEEIGRLPEKYRRRSCFATLKA